jgi:hypothetical protein
MKEEKIDIPIFSEIEFSEVFENKKEMWRKWASNPPAFLIANQVSTPSRPYPHNCTDKRI